MLGGDRKDKLNECMCWATREDALISNKPHLWVQDDRDCGSRGWSLQPGCSQPRQISSPYPTDDPICHEQRLRPGAHLLTEVNGSPRVHGPLWIGGVVIRRDKQQFRRFGGLTNPPMKLYFPKSNTAALPMYASDPR